MRPLPRLTLLYPALALLAAALAPHSVARAPPDTFSLPEPTPSPSAAPEVEGPTDDAAPLRAAPQSVPENVPVTPVPEVETTAPATTPGEVEALPDNSAIVANPIVQALPTGSPEAGASGPAQQPAPPTQNSSTGQEATGTLAPQASETAIAAEPESDLPPTSSDLPAIETEIAAAASEPALTPEGFDPNDPISPLWWLVALIGVILAGAVGWIYLRRSTAPTAMIERPVVAGAIALGSLEEAKLKLSLDVMSATRSMMMFTLEYRLQVSNRSDRAIRGLSVTPELTSAQRGSSQVKGPALAYGAGETRRIDRIGPHQSEVVTDSVQLPVSDIRPILQGTKPLFVPLLQFQLRLEGLDPVTHTFVIGEPSATNAARLHPIALDTPPGGLPGLYARKLET